MKEADLLGSGIYGIMIKNVIELMNAELKTNDNGWNTLNLLKNQLLSITNSKQLADYISKNSAAFDKEHINKGSSIANHLKFVTAHHSYVSAPTFSKGNADYDHFKAIYKGDGDKNKFSIQQLPYLGAWESTLDLTNFNTATLVAGVPTSALTFTNNYLESTGDIFITRPTK